MLRPFLAVCCASLLLAGAVGAGHAQLIHGQVLHAGTRRPLPDVAITLRTTEGRVLTTGATDSAGAFRLHAPRTGSYELVAERIGFTTVVSPLTVNVSEELELALQLDVAAVSLDPLVIKARNPYDLGFLAGYYERLSRHDKLGLGRIITRDQIDERGALDVVDLLRELPRMSIVRDRSSRGAHVMFRGGATGECTPRVFLNGILLNRRDRAYIDEYVEPHDLEGIEVYAGLAQLPGEYHDETGCGVILLWTRRADPTGRPFSWKRLIVAAGAAAVILFLIR